MTDFIDLHVHSNCSDGTYSPAELVALAKQQGLRAFALTDHDTTSGVDEALEAACGTGIEVIPGIEFSTSHKGKDVHILGLGIDHRNLAFQQEIENMRQKRHQRNLQMIEKLREQDIDISYEKILAQYPDCTDVWTRAHFSRYLLDHGYVSSHEEAFEKYIGDHACCYVARPKVSPTHVISLIHQAGGYAVLAHPMFYKFSEEEIEQLTAICKEAGADGIETIYSRNTEEQEQATRQLAARYHLKMTGGSDFHGTNKPDIALGTGQGDLKVPYALWEELQK